MKTFLRLGLLLSVALIAFSSVQSVAALGGGWEVLGEHTVKAGETVYCIARAYAVDPWAITTQNDLARPNLIHPGQVLSIPNVPAEIPPGPVCTPQFGATMAAVACGDCTCRATHLVTWGNTLSWISIYYGVDMWSIAQCNCITNLNYIRAGESLCIP
jgi:N-acetylmuramoyl-L-alanine amidase